MTRHGNAQPELDDKDLEAATAALASYITGHCGDCGGSGEAPHSVAPCRFCGGSGYRDATAQRIATEAAKEAVSAYLLAAGGTGERERREASDESARIAVTENALLVRDVKNWLGPAAYQKFCEWRLSPSPVSPAGREDQTDQRSRNG